MGHYLLIPLVTSLLQLYTVRGRIEKVGFINWSIILWFHSKYLISRYRYGIKTVCGIHTINFMMVLFYEIRIVQQYLVFQTVKCSFNFWRRLHCSDVSTRQYNLNRVIAFCKSNADICRIGIITEHCLSIRPRVSDRQNVAWRWSKGCVYTKSRITMELV